MAQKYSKEEIVSRIQFYCSNRERCLSEVHDKLLNYGAKPNDIQTIIRELESLNFLNETRFSKAYANDKFKLKHWGKIKIKYMMKGKKINETLIQKALDEIDYDQYLDVLKTVLYQKLNSLKKEDKYTQRNKLYRYLTGRGFESSLISEELKKALP